MGELVRNVRIRALSTDGDPGDDKVYRALIDTGTTKTVIPQRILDDLGHKVLPGNHTFFRGRRIPVALVLIQIVADENCSECEPRAVVAAVSTTLAGKGGKGVDLILGHDYMQEAEVSINYANPHAVGCSAKKKKSVKRKQHV